MFDLNYLPPVPKNKTIGIGVIGCGNIATLHLNAYRDLGLNVIALADINPANLAKKAQMIPGVRTFNDYHDLLAIKEIEVVDCPLHPEPRVQVIKDALNAGKHVLSQKPFVTDIAVGEELISLAQKQNRLLAVNQNGRWNPAWSYAWQAIRNGVIGEVTSINTDAYWNHNPLKNNPVFNGLHHLILYDYAIHWFDIVNVWTQGRTAQRVYASACRLADQEATPPLLANVLIEYDGIQCAMTFNGNQKIGLHRGSERSYFIAGTKGCLHCRYDNMEQPFLEVYTATGVYRPNLTGTWYTNGFRGTMSELLCAIEENRLPWNNAKDNLTSLKLCFAACRSADQKAPVALSS